MTARVQLSLLTLLALAASCAALLAAAPKADAYIYWSYLGGFFEGHVGRATNDGKAVETKWIKKTIGSTSVEVDDRFVYWINNDSQSIGRAKLNGKKVDQHFIDDVGFASDLDVYGDHIYWTRSSEIDVDAGIARASLDGSDVEFDFIHLDGWEHSGLGDIAVSGDHIYWTNFWKRNRISRARIDGTEVEPDFMEVGPKSPYGLTIAGDYLYWSGSSKDIGRARLDGSEADPLFIEDVGRASSLVNDGTYLYWPGSGPGKADQILRTKLSGAGRVKAIVKEGADGGSLAIDDRGPGGA